MVNSYLLAKVLNYNKYNITDLAAVLQMDRDQIKWNLQHGIWQSNELESMLQILDWPINPFEVFFSTYNPEEFDF